MPLSNNIIIKLNEITQLVENKNLLKDSEINEIRSIFSNILKNGEYYNVDEIESWFKNEGTWNSKKIRDRITNISHYILTKFEQTNKFRVLGNDDSCSCGH